MTRRLQALTAIGRPLDPAWPTNRAVLLLMPLAALIGSVRAWAGQASVPGAALGGGAVVLGGWALGRELDPDRQGAAFVSMGLATAVLWIEPSASLLLLFTVLALVRVVNRTVGPPATGLDLVVVLALLAWCVRDTGSAGIALAGALAFGLDAYLDGDRPLGWAAAAAAVGVGLGVVSAGSPSPGPTTPAPRWALASALAVSAAFLVVLVRTREVRSRTDRSDDPLDPIRVRWGMGVAWIAAVTLLGQGTGGLRTGGLLWAALAGVALWRPLAPHSPRT